MDFLERLKKNAEKIKTGVQNRAVSVLKGARDYFQPESGRTRVRDVVREVPEQLSMQVGQPQLRAYSSLAGFLSRAKLTPSTPFQKDLYGTDKEINLTKTGREFLAQDPEKQSGAFGKVAFPIVGFIGAGSDLVPGGSGGKRAIQESVEAIAKTRRSADVVENLAKIGIKASDDVIRTLRRTDNPQNVSTIVTDLMSRGRTVPEGQAGKALSQAEETLPTGRPTQGKPAGRLPEGEADTALRSAGEAYDDTMPQVFDSRKYVDEMIQKREAARKEGTTGLTETYRDLKKSLIDSTAPIEDTLKRVTEKAKVTMLPGGNVTNQIDNTLRANSLAGQFMEDAGLADIIKKVDDLDELDQYLIAKQATDVNMRGFETGRDLTKDQDLIKSLGPKYEEAAKIVNDYSRKVLDYSVESGIISKDLADTLKKIYPNYVPINRVFSELENADMFSGRGGVASLSKQTVVKKLKGSSREIENPIKSLLEKTNDAFLQGEKNKTAKALADTRKIPGMEGIIRELEPGETAKHTFSYLDDGIKRTFETTPDIARAAKSLSPQQMNTIQRVFAGFMRVFKLGTTGLNPGFIPVNVARDQITAFINSDKPVKTSIFNTKNFMKSLMSALKHDDLYKEWIRSGGGGTSYDLTRSASKATLESIRSQRSTTSRIKYLATNPAELLKTLEDLAGRSDEVTRLQQYAGVRDAYLRQGASPEYAQAMGARAARETTANFHRKGEMGQVLNSLIPYFTASIAGTRATLKAFRKNPAKVAASTATVLMFPMASLTAWNLSDPKRKQAYDDIEEYEKEGNFIFVPPNPTKDENGSWNVIKIPLPPGIGNVTIPIRRGMEQMAGLDDVKFKEISDALIGVVSPFKPNMQSLMQVAVPQAFKPTVQSFANKDFFTELPIVPRSLEGLSPELQYRDNTSGSTRFIAEKLGKSPIKVEKFIKDTFGGLGSIGINIIDRLTGQEVVGGRSVSEDISRRFTEATGGKQERLSTESSSEAIRSQEDKRAITKKEAQKIYEKLKESDDKELAKATLLELAKTDPELAKKVLDIAEEESLGLSYADKQVKRLGVENGARAQYISDKLDSLGTDTEKKAYLKDLAAKKILTDSVLQQVLDLRSTQ